MKRNFAKKVCAVLTFSAVLFGSIACSQNLDYEEGLEISAPSEENTSDRHAFNQEFDPTIDRPNHSGRGGRNR